MRIRTVVSLNRGGKGVEIEATMDNQAKDHRVRALFPTDLQASSHNVDSMFEVATRDNEPAPNGRTRVIRLTNRLSLTLRRLLQG